MNDNLKLKFIVKFDRNNSSVDLKEFCYNTETLLKEIYNKFFSNESFSISISIFQNIETLCKNFYGNNNKTGNFSYAMYEDNANTIKTCIPSHDEFKKFRDAIIFAFSRALIFSFPNKQPQIYDYLKEYILLPFNDRLTFKYNTKLFKYHCEVKLSQKTIIDLDDNLTKVYEKASEIWDVKKLKDNDILIFHDYPSFYNTFFSNQIYKGVLGILSGLSPCFMVAIPNPECIEKDTNGKKKYEDIIQVVTHEFVHRINLTIDPYNSIPYWMFEGIAEKLTNNHLFDNLSKIEKNKVEIEKVFGENLDAFYRNQGYIIAPIALIYIENEYGEAVLRQMLNTPRDCLKLLYPEIQDSKSRHNKFIKEYSSYITKLI